MTLLWLGPLVTLGFIVGFAISAILLRMGRLSHPLSWLAAFGLPFIGAALPIVLLLAASVLGLFTTQAMASAGL